MAAVEMSDNEQRFLIELYRQTGGDDARQSSMYDIGAAMGWERTDASRIAEELIGSGLVAVKTLSGGVGITDAGIAAVQELGFGKPDPATGGRVALGDGPVLDDSQIRSVAQVAAALKLDAGEKKWRFEILEELVADLRTLDAQLSSPRPKTAIVRACFASMAALLEKSHPDAGSLAQMRRLLGA